MIRDIHWLITDFDRTLVQLFKENELLAIQKELKTLYRGYGLSEDFLNQSQDPYEIWFRTYQYIVKYFSASTVKEIHNAASTVLTNAELRAASHVALLPGVPNTLNWIKHLQINCAIVSSNSTKAIRLTLANNRIDKMIMNVFGRDNYFKMEYLKPNPTLIEHAIIALGAKREHTVFIGDSEHDIVAGKAAGLFVIGVLSGKTVADTLLKNGADAVLTSFSSLLNFGHFFGVD